MLAQPSYHHAVIFALNPDFVNVTGPKLTGKRKRFKTNMGHDGRIGASFCRLDNQYTILTRKTCQYAYGWQGISSCADPKAYFMHRAQSYTFAEVG